MGPMYSATHVVATSAMTLQQRVTLLIRRQQLIPPGSRLLLAVSGGTDSLVLLHLFSRLSPEFGLSPHVASLDHGLRGADGAADAAFVREQAEQLGLQVTLGTAKRLRGEADARHARYDFLAATARAWGAQYVAVAHHADDQAETVLLNVLRGSGLRGLAAMRLSAPLPGHPQLTLLRPLLHIRRSELQDWCHTQGLAPRQDASNRDLRLRRNRLRHETLPALRELNPRVDQALLRLAGTAAQDIDFIQEQLAAATENSLRCSPQRIRLARSTFDGLHSVLQRHFVLDALRRLGGQEIGSGHVESLVALAKTGVTGQRLSLPGALQLRLEYEDLILEHSDAASDWPGPLLCSDNPLAVCNPGVTILPGEVWRLYISTTRIADECPQARLALPPGATLTLGTRLAGERFDPPGLGGHTQSLKDWMINRHLPRDIRQQIPLLRVNGAIATIFTDTQAVPATRFMARAGVANARYCAIYRNR